MLRSPSGMRPVKSAAHQPSSAVNQTNAEVRPGEQESGNGQQAAKSVTSLAARAGGSIARSSGIASGLADEAREWAADEQEEGFMTCVE